MRIVDDSGSSVRPPARRPGPERCGRTRDRGNEHRGVTAWPVLLLREGSALRGYQDGIGQMEPITCAEADMGSQKLDLLPCSWHNPT